MMASAVLLLLGGVGILYFGAEWLVRGSVSIARSVGLSPVFVGLTVVSFGTSAPELVVATLASFQGTGDLAMGNVLGSNLANLGLIMGLTALIQPLAVEAQVVRREIPILIVITALIFPVLMNLEISRVEGAFLLSVLVAYLVYIARAAQHEKAAVLGEYEKFTDEEVPGGDVLGLAKNLGLVIAGAAALTFGGKAIVDSATRLAVLMGFSPLEIGLTVVAVGTSLPELATSLVAALRKEADIAVGNIVGSNIFNLTAITGVASLVRPIEVQASVMSQEYPATLFLTLALFPIARSRYDVNRMEGALLLSLYVVIWILVFH